jgi:hypothetical protein
VLWNGIALATSVVNSTTLRALVPNSFANDSGTAFIQVRNQAPPAQGGGTSLDSLRLGIFYPTPVLNSITPAFATAAVPARITLLGTNVAPGAAQVQLSATFLPEPILLQNVQRLSTDSLVVTIPASLLTTRGLYSLRVINPPTAAQQGGGTSAARTLTVVNPKPELTALLPNTTTASGKAWTLTLVGAKFTATSQIRYNGVLQSLANTSFLADTTSGANSVDTLRVKLPAVPVNDTTFTFSVFNPSSIVNAMPQGGGESDTLRLAIGLPQPHITSISPATTTATLGVVERAWTLTVNGAFFDANAQVFVNGAPVPTTFVATTRLRAQLPDSLQNVQARRTVQVRNTPALVSNTVQQTVYNPTPVLLTLTPNSITAGRDTTLVLTGDKFTPNARVVLVFGATTNPLTITRRDSVLGLTVRVPDTLISRRGTYSVRVINPFLQLDTTTIGGGLDALPLTVDAASVASVEFAGVDTLLYANDRLNAFILRFRDKTGNLVDNDPVTLNYSSLPDTTLPDSLRPALVRGTLAVTRLSLGTYRSDTLRFPVAANYRLWVDTAQTGRLTVLGKNYFTVLTRSAVAVEVVGIEPTINAGQTQRFTVSYADNQGNRTDVGVRPVIITASLPGINYRYVIGSTRLRTGVYEMEVLRFTTSGNYTVHFTGIDTLNITGNRRFTAFPTAAASVQFTGVTPVLVAGQTQARFRAIFRDSLNNLTDGLLPEQLSVRYSNSTAASVAGASTDAAFGAIGITRTSLGNYQADLAERFPLASAFSLSVAGINITTGTAQFLVRPAGDARVEFIGVPQTIFAGQDCPTFTVNFKDASGNLTDNNLGIVYAQAANGSRAVNIPVVQVSQGIYQSSAFTLTTVGTFRLRVLGIDTLNTLSSPSSSITPTQGVPRLTIQSPPPPTAYFSNLDSVLVAGQSQKRFRITFRDTFNNLVDFGGNSNTYGDLSASFANDSTINRPANGVILMKRVSKGVYEADIQRFTISGTYRITIAGIINTQGNTVCVVSPSVASSANVADFPTSLSTGDILPPFTITYTDQFGNLTDSSSVALVRIGGGYDTPLTFQNLNQGRYRLVSDSTLRITKTGTYILRLGGITTNNIIGNDTVKVSAQYVVAELSNMDTVLVAGTLQKAFTVTYRDFFGNLVDVEGTATYFSSQSSSSGTIALRRTSLGVSTATQTRFNVAGTYTLRVDAPFILGTQASFTVLPTLALSAEINDVQTDIVAGDSLPAFSVTYFDRFGNRTDSSAKVGAYRNASNTVNGTIALTRTSNGTYRSSPVFFSDVNTYTISLSGISAANLRGNTSFVVRSSPAVAARITQVLPTLRAGNNQSAFQITYYDKFNNLTDNDTPVWFSNSTDATVANSTGTIRMSRVRLGVYTAESTKFTSVGLYTLAVTDVSNLIGTSAFAVQPQTAAQARFIDVTPEIAAGGRLSEFIVEYRDRFGNPADFAGTMRYAGPSSTGTISMLKQELGVFKSQPTPFSKTGAYKVFPNGLDTNNLSGERTFTVFSTLPDSVEIIGLPDSIKAGAVASTLQVKFRNAAGVLMDYAADLRFIDNEVTSTGTITLQKVSAGTYTPTLTPSWVRSGFYSVSVGNTHFASQERTLNVQPEKAAIASLDAVPTKISAGEQVPPLEMTFRDKYGNLSDYLGAVAVKNANNSSTGTMTLQKTRTGKAIATSTDILETPGMYSVIFDSTVFPKGQRDFEVRDVEPNEPFISKVEAISTLSPLGTTIFANDFSQLVIYGKNFKQNARIIRDTVRIYTDTLQSIPIRLVTSPGVLLTPRTGLFSLAVENPDGVRSNDIVLTAYSWTPEITSFSKAFQVPQIEIFKNDTLKAAAGDRIQLRIRGNYFAIGAEVIVGDNNGRNPIFTTRFDSTYYGGSGLFGDLTVNIPASTFKQNAVNSITVINPLPSRGNQLSDKFNFYFKVESPQMVIQRVLPDTLRIGKQDTLALTGRSFSPTAAVYWNGQTPLRVLSRRDSTSIRVVVPDSLTRATGVISISLSDSATGRSSNTVNLPIVNPKPRILVIVPDSTLFVGKRQRFWFFVPQEQFAVQNYSLKINNAVIDKDSIGIERIISGGRLWLVGLTSKQIRGGINTFTLTNAAPGGGSDEKQFNAIYPLPQITGLNPISIAAYDSVDARNARDTVITVFGRNFTDTTTIILGNGQVLQPFNIDSTRLNVRIPGSYFLTPRMVARDSIIITASNPPTLFTVGGANVWRGGGTSNRAVLNIRQTPTIISAKTINDSFSYNYSPDSLNFISLISSYMDVTCVKGKGNVENCKVAVIDGKNYSCKFLSSNGQVTIMRVEISNNNVYSGGTDYYYTLGSGNHSIALQTPEGVVSKPYNISMLTQTPKVNRVDGIHNHPVYPHTGEYVYMDSLLSDQRKVFLNGYEKIILLFRGSNLESNTKFILNNQLVLEQSNRDGLLALLNIPLTNISFDYLYGHAGVFTGTHLLRPGWNTVVAENPVAYIYPRNSTPRSQVFRFYLPIIINVPITVDTVMPRAFDIRLVGETPSFDTLTVNGTNFSDRTTVFWKTTKRQDTLNIISYSTTRISALVPTAIRDTVPGGVRIIISNTGFNGGASISTQTIEKTVQVEYPNPRITSVTPDTVSVPTLPPGLAYKENGAEVNADGNQRESSVVAGLPATVMLFPNAPNPFAGSTRLEYALNKEATVILEVYDQMGRRVAELVQQRQQQAGVYSIDWNAERFASGVYTAILQVRLISGEVTRKTMPMTIIR